MTLGVLTDERFAALLGDNIHPAGCVYGGFSCGYWMVAPGCKLDHWERHIVLEDHCPCGNVFPEVTKDIVFIRLEDEQ